MQEVSAIYTIRSKYQSLSTKEKMIADFILEHPKESVNPSIEKLAERIGISESTMVRFARKLGYNGYQRFRIALARETIPKSEQLYETEVSEGEEVLGMVFKNTQQALLETLQTVDRKAFKNAADLIYRSRSVYLMGLGGSNILAQDAYHKLIRIGLDCQYTSDFHMQLMLASQAGGHDVALIISHTGEGYDTLALAEELRGNECKLIVLTSNIRSPLAKLGDAVLSVSTYGSRIVAESFSARIASLVLIDALYVEILELMGYAGMENLNRMRTVIAKRRI
ncbi:MurR/RpiR family transcriptional regulator [Sphaerochaeta sp.]|uniref:MurR/RpiR family transcriptional regulator n=1 Tax=Sphaerochaeta sp. TaxID=1972642 RepID=UPI003D0CF90D